MALNGTNEGFEAVAVVVDYATLLKLLLALDCQCCTGCVTPLVPAATLRK